MKSKILTLLAITFTLIEVSGQDTIYFDKAWKQTLKDNTTFYRVQNKEGNGFRIQDFYLSGKLQMSGFSLSGDSLFREGLFNYYDEDGNLTIQGNYKQNHETGLWKSFYPNGKLYTTQFFNEENNADGEFIVYYSNGKIRRSDSYKNGKFLKGKCYLKSGRDTTWFPFFVKPEFIGGEAKRIKYLKENIIYPVDAKEVGIQGIVYVSFYVCENGTLGNVRINRGVHSLLDDEALRVVKSMPRWKPGQSDGKPIKTEFLLPIKFTLN